MITYAGIGSRSTPIEIRKEMTSIAQMMGCYGYTLRSGNADGADIAFQRGAVAAEIFLPWSGFNRQTSADHIIYDEPTDEAMKFASSIHPFWKKLGHAAKKFHARNCHQVLGYYLDEPVDMVICWTPDGCEDEDNYTVGKTGGTGTAIVIASKCNIPVINLCNDNWRHRIKLEIEESAKARTS